MKIGSVVTTLLLTTITVLSSARPGRGTGQASSVPRTIKARSAGSITGITMRVSVASDGSQGYGHSSRPSISADGRIIAFSSHASLTVDDSNICENVHPYPRYENCSDIFVHDRDSGKTTRVSVASDGTEGNNHSYVSSISANGRFVAFSSHADNLVSNDNNGSQDVFVHDRETEKTTRISVASDGSEANDVSNSPTISADGRIVAFTSYADNLVSGDSNGSPDVFMHDRDTGETIRVSVAFDGSQGNGNSYAGSISVDGRFVVFDSLADNLVGGDNNGYRDVFVYDRDIGETSLVSVSTGGAQGNADSLAISISSDGQFVLFDSWADNLVGGDSNGYRDVFVHDRDTGETTRVSVTTDGLQGDNETYGAAISADGRFVVFDSLADNLVDDDINGYQDVFLHDRDSGETIRVSVASGGIEAGNLSRSPAISAGGNAISFSSRAQNLVSDDTNTCYVRFGTPPPCQDVFVHDRDTVPTFVPLMSR